VFVVAPITSVIGRPPARPHHGGLTGSDVFGGLDHLVDVLRLMKITALAVGRDVIAGTDQRVAIITGSLLAISTSRPRAVRAVQPRANTEIVATCFVNIAQQPVRHHPRTPRSLAPRVRIHQEPAPPRYAARSR